MTTIRAGRRIGFLALVAVTVAAVGCSRGPDATALQTEVQGKLDQRFKPGLFGLVGFKRQGSAPLPASDAGAKRLAVYFNATLKMNQGYDFGDWEGLSPATLAHVLGATDKGIYGLKAGDEPAGRGDQGLRQLDLRVVGRQVAERRGHDGRRREGAGARQRRPRVAVEAAHRPPRRHGRHSAARGPAGGRGGDQGGARPRAAGDHRPARAPEARLHGRQRTRSG